MRAVFIAIYLLSYYTLKGVIEGEWINRVWRMYWDMKAEHETCLEDIEDLRTENEALKEVNVAQTNYTCKLLEENKELERENKEQLELLQEFSKFINYKLIVSPANEKYKDFRRELDKLGVK